MTHNYFRACDKFEEIWKNLIWPQLQFVKEYNIMYLGKKSDHAVLRWYHQVGDTPILIHGDS